MEFYSSEKEQVEALRKWWAENWLYIATGLTLGIIAVVGWNQYQAYVLERAQQASQKYTEMVGAFNVEAQPIAEDILTELKGEFSSTPYASDAALYAAAVYVNMSDLENAERELRWVINESTDLSKGALARIRMARIMIATSRYQAAIDELAGMDDTGYGALANAVRGDAFSAMDEREAAMGAYALALEHAKPDALDRELVQLKLDRLKRYSTSAAESETGDDDLMEESQ